MDERIKRLISNWQKRNISGIYCVNKEEALGRILQFIPQGASVGISGSVTLDQLGVVSALTERGNVVFNQYKPGISREENLELRRKGAGADYYLASPNAVSENGELVFFSAYGNRTAGVSYAANVIIVAGINKITPDLQKAMERSRKVATPLNAKRLNYAAACFGDGECHNEICLFPGYKRMCCQVLTIEAEITPERMKVILVGESLGF